MNPSPSQTPALRTWAVRFSLLVAVIASVATSPPRVDERVELKGTSFTVTTDAPRSTRRFVVRVSAKGRPEEGVSLDAEGQLTARWQPADPASTATPWLRTRVVLGSAEGLSNPASFPPTPGEALQQRAWVGLPASECKLESGPCTLEGTLEVELGFDGAPAEGTVAVDWGVGVTATFFDANELPEGFTLTLTEP